MAHINELIVDARTGKKMLIFAIFATLILIGCSLVEEQNPTEISTSQRQPAVISAASEVMGHLEFPYLSADAGNFALQAGEQITLTWQDAPIGAESYELILLLGGSQEILIDKFKIPAEGPPSLSWLVPEGVSGDLVGTARFEDGSSTRSGCCSTIYTGALPPEGICTMRVPGMMPVNIYELPTEESVRVARVAPGLYLEVLERTPEGWYRVQTTKYFGADPDNPQPISGFLDGEPGVSLFGPCEAIPIYQPTTGADPGKLSPGWVEAVDPVTGIRLAVPCFWIVDFPEKGARAVSGAGSLRNYEYREEMKTPGQSLFEQGAIKIDLVFSYRSKPGDTPIERLYAYKESLSNPEAEGTDISVDEVEVNGQVGLHVHAEGVFGPTQYLIFEMPDRSIMIFSPNPQAFDQPDVQAILNSLALSPNTPLGVPTNPPAPRPFGESAACLTQVTELPG